MVARNTAPSSFAAAGRAARRLLHVIGGTVVALTILTAANSLCAQYDEDSKLTDAAFAEKRVAELIAQLDHADASERVEAIRKLARLGQEARPATSKLIDLLSDDATYREYVVQTVVSTEASRAVVAIGSEAVTPLREQVHRQSKRIKSDSTFIARQIGPAARGLLPQFLREYKAADEDERANLLAAIAAIDHSGSTALPLLLKAIRNDKSHYVRETAARWLTRSTLLTSVYWKERAPAADWFSNTPQDRSRAANVLRTALRDRSPDVRALAAISLSTYPESADRFVPGLIYLLGDSGAHSVMYSHHVVGQEAVADAAANALVRFPNHLDRSLPRLIKVALDAERPVWAARFAIAGLIPRTKQPLDYVQQLLDSDQPDLAFLPLARYGKSSRAIILKLQQLTVDDDKPVALKASITLACLDATAYPNAVSAVQKALTLKEAQTEKDIDTDRTAVCRFVESVGPNASFTVPLLKQYMLEGDDSDEFDWAVVSALASIGVESAPMAPILIDHLDKGYGFFVDEKEDTLVAFGPKIVPLLIRALENPEKSAPHRIGCLHVLGRFGSSASDAVPAVVSQLKSKYPRVREAAVQALGDIAARPTESLAALQNTLSDPRPFVRAKGASSMAAFGLRAKKSVPALIDALSDSYLDVRVAAASSLGHLGSIARDAIPVLESLADVQSVHLRDTARVALEAIRAK